MIINCKITSTKIIIQYKRTFHLAQGKTKPRHFSFVYFALLYLQSHSPILFIVTISIYLVPLTTHQINEIFSWIIRYNREIIESFSFFKPQVSNFIVSFLFSCTNYILRQEFIRRIVIVINCIGIWIFKGQLIIVSIYTGLTFHPKINHSTLIGTISYNLLFSTYMCWILKQFFFLKSRVQKSKRPQ